MTVVTVVGVAVTVAVVPMCGACSRASAAVPGAAYVSPGRGRHSTGGPGPGTTPQGKALHHVSHCIRGVGPVLGKGRQGVGGGWGRLHRSEIRYKSSVISGGGERMS